MAINYLSDINLNKNTLENAVVHPSPTAPSTPIEGQIYYNNTAGDKKLYIYNGTSFNAVDGTSVATDTTLGSLKVYTGTGATANTITTTPFRTYGVQLDANNKAVVNVPHAIYGIATATHPGLIELFNNTDQTVDANTVTSTAGRTYGIQLNAADQAVVNVPWENTVYAHATNANLDGVVTSEGNTTAIADAALSIAKTNGLQTALDSKASLDGATFTGGVSGTDLTLSGNLTINGTTTTINANTLDVKDKNITLGDVATPSDATADGGGITLKGDDDKTFNWVSATDAWTSSERLNLLTGKAYLINNASVLSATTLGSNVVNSSLTSVGTIGTGVWNGTTIAGQYGGTGVDNGEKTITLGGDLTTSGSHETILTTIGDTGVTLPTTGTLATEAYVSAKNKSFNLAGGVLGVTVTGTGTGTIFTIAHGMGSSLLYSVQVIRTNGGSGETVFTDVNRTLTTITITFKVAPTDGDYTALITKMN